LVSHEGVQLAPFYDLLSAASYETTAFDKRGWPEQTQLAWPILGVRHFSSISRSVLLEAGAALSLAKGTADRVLESLRGRVAAEAQALCAEVEAENAEIVGVRPELAALLPLLLLNNSFQNDILHSQRWQILTKAPSLVHRFFSGLHSADANAGHGVNYRQMAAERRLDRHPQSRMALGYRSESVGKIAQDVPTGCQKHRCHHDRANALRNQNVDGLRQIGTHEFKKVT
jgi:hypothetical protein